MIEEKMLRMLRAVKGDLVKLVELAQAEEREACCEIADEWAMSYVEVDSAALGVGKYIQQERTAK